MENIIISALTLIRIIVVSSISGYIASLLFYSLLRWVNPVKVMKATIKARFLVTKWTTFILYFVGLILARILFFHLIGPQFVEHMVCIAAMAYSFALADISAEEVKQEK